MKKKIAIGIVMILISFSFDDIVKNTITYGSFLLKTQVTIISITTLIALCSYAVIKGKRKVAQLLLTQLSATIVVQIVKAIVGRARPEEIISISSNSFPSNHATLAFIAVPFAFKVNKKVGWFWLFISINIALSRIALNAHYFSDVIAGGIFGSLFGWWSYQWWGKRDKKK